MADKVREFLTRYEAALAAAQQRDATLEAREESEGYSDKLGSERIDETERQATEWAWLLGQAVDLLKEFEAADWPSLARKLRESRESAGT